VQYCSVRVREKRYNIWLQKAPRGQGQRGSRSRPMPGRFEARAKAREFCPRGRGQSSRTTSLVPPAPVNYIKYHLRAAELSPQSVPRALCRPQCGSEVSRSGWLHLYMSIHRLRVTCRLISSLVELLSRQACMHAPGCRSHTLAVKYLPRTGNI